MTENEKNMQNQPPEEENKQKKRGLVWFGLGLATTAALGGVYAYNMNNDDIQVGKGTDGTTVRRDRTSTLDSSTDISNEDDKDKALKKVVEEVRSSERDIAGTSSLVARTDESKRTPGLLDTLVTTIIPTPVLADEVEKEKKPEGPVQNGKDDTEKPVLPIDPTDPTIPIEPPIDPVDPPVDPIDPPVDPIDPPVDPIDPPVTPEGPTAEQIASAKEKLEAITNKANDVKDEVSEASKQMDTVINITDGDRVKEDALADKLTALEESIAKYAELEEALKGLLDDSGNIVEGKEAEYASAYEELSAAHSDVVSKYQETQKQYDGYVNTLTEAEKALKAVENVDATVDSINGKLDQLDKDKASAKEYIDSVEGLADKVTNESNQANVSVGKAKEDTAKLEEKAEEAKAAYEDAKEAVEADKEVIKGLGDSVTQAKEDVENALGGFNGLPTPPATTEPEPEGEGEVDTEEEVIQEEVTEDVVEDTQEVVSTTEEVVVYDATPVEVEPEVQAATEVQGEVITLQSGEEPVEIVLPN